MKQLLATVLFAALSTAANAQVTCQTYGNTTNCNGSLGSGIAAQPFVNYGAQIAQQQLQNQQAALAQQQAQLMRQQAEFLRQQNELTRQQEVAAQQQAARERVAREPAAAAALCSDNTAMGVYFENSGTIWGIHPLNTKTYDHLKQNIRDGSWRDRSLIVPPSFIEHFIDVFKANGGVVCNAPKAQS